MKNYQKKIFLITIYILLMNIVIPSISSFGQLKNDLINIGSFLNSIEDDLHSYGNARDQNNEIKLLQRIIEKIKMTENLDINNLYYIYQFYIRYLSLLKNELEYLIDNKQNLPDTLQQIQDLIEKIDPWLPSTSSPPLDEEKRFLRKIRLRIDYLYCRLYLKTLRNSSQITQDDIDKIKILYNKLNDSLIAFRADDIADNIHWENHLLSIVKEFQRIGNIQGYDNTKEIVITGKGFLNRYTEGLIKFFRGINPINSELLYEAKSDFTKFIEGEDNKNSVWYKIAAIDSKYRILLIKEKLNLNITNNEIKRLSQEIDTIKFNGLMKVNFEHYIPLITNDIIRIRKKYHQGFIKAIQKADSLIQVHSYIAASKIIKQEINNTTIDDNLLLEEMLIMQLTALYLNYSSTMNNRDMSVFWVQFNEIQNPKLIDQFEYLKAIMYERTQRRNDALKIYKTLAERDDPYSIYKCIKVTQSQNQVPIEDIRHNLAKLHVIYDKIDKSTSRIIKDPNHYFNNTIKNTYEELWDYYMTESADINVYLDKVAFSIDDSTLFEKIMEPYLCDYYTNIESNSNYGNQKSYIANFLLPPSLLSIDHICLLGVVLEVPKPRITLNAEKLIFNKRFENEKLSKIWVRYYENGNPTEPEKVDLPWTSPNSIKTNKIRFQISPCEPGYQDTDFIHDFSRELKEKSIRFVPKTIQQPLNNEIKLRSRYIKSLRKFVIQPEKKIGFISGQGGIIKFFIDNDEPSIDIKTNFNDIINGLCYIDKQIPHLFYTNLSQNSLGLVRFYNNSQDTNTITIPLESKKPINIVSIDDYILIMCSEGSEKIFGFQSSMPRFKLPVIFTFKETLHTDTSLLEFNDWWFDNNNLFICDPIWDCIRQFSIQFEEKRIVLNEISKHCEGLSDMPEKVSIDSNRCIFILDSKQQINVFTEHDDFITLIDQKYLTDPTDIYSADDITYILERKQNKIIKIKLIWDKKYIPDWIPN